MISRSVAQIATASIRTSTSARAGTGVGFSVMDSSPGPPRIQAFIVSGTANSAAVFTLGWLYIGVSCFSFVKGMKRRLIAQVGRQGGRAPDHLLPQIADRRLISADRRAGDFDRPDDRTGF